MLNILNRDCVQSVDEVAKEFPNNRFLMRMNDIFSGTGYLIAVSETSDTHDELCALRNNYTKDTVFL